MNSLQFLNESHKDDPFREYLERNQIRHIRIPLYSPWVGNAWERLIRIVKGCIYKCVGRKHLEYFSFISLLTDIGNAINSRPLTYGETEVDELHIITPNSFLKLQEIPRVSFESLDQVKLPIPPRTGLVSNLSKREDLFDVFKDMWYEYYLLSLREHSRKIYPGNWEELIKVGDVVLIYSSTKPRHCW